MVGDAKGLMLNDPESEWHLRAPAAGGGIPLAQSANPTSPSLGGSGWGCPAFALPSV